MEESKSRSQQREGGGDGEEEEAKRGGMRKGLRGVRSVVQTSEVRLLNEREEVGANDGKKNGGGSSVD